MAYTNFRGRGGRGRAAPYGTRPHAKTPQLSEPCMIYTRTGRCDQRPGCRYQHMPGRTAVCQQYIKTGRCVKQDNERCTLSHTPLPENAPMCVHYARGNCSKEDCQFAHMTQLGTNPEEKPTCRRFALNGWCDRGLNCTKRHSFECPDFEAYGKCPNSTCKLPHVIRAKALAEAKNSPSSTLDNRDSKLGALGTLSGKSEMVNVDNFLAFLHEATRESCTLEYTPGPVDQERHSEQSGEESPSDSESDIDWANDDAAVDETPLDTGADFISV